MSKRAIVSFILALVVIATAFYLGNWMIKANKREKPQVQKAVKVVFSEVAENGDVPIVVRANGNLTAKRKIELFAETQGVFRSSGKLFRAGQAYRKGEVLLRLDASEYLPTVQVQKSTLYNQIAAVLPDLRLDYPDAYPKWLNYLEQFDVTKPVAPLPEIQSEQERFFINGNEIVTTYYRIRNLEQRLQKFTIRAPFNGVLTEALVTEGTLIRSGQKLGEFIDDGAYEMELAVNSSYASFLKVGEKVMLRGLGGVNGWEGKVTRINAKVNQDTQTISVFVEADGDGLREGMYLDAYIDVRKEANAVEVKRELLVNRGQLFVVRDSVLGLIDVEPIYFSDENVVLKGIPDGTVLVSQPVPGAYAGMLVRQYEAKDNTEKKEIP